MTSETFLRVRNLPEVKVNKGPECRCGCSLRYFLMAVTGHVDVPVAPMRTIAVLPKRSVFECLRVSLMESSRTVMSR